MSTKCLAWGIDQKTGSATRKIVLLLLCDLADEQLTCYPGREWLAGKAELSVRAVSDAVTQLVADGYLRVLRRARRRGGRTSNRYLIMVYGPDTPMPDVDDWVSEFAADDPGQGNSAPDAHTPGDDDDDPGQGNSAPGAHTDDGGNGAPGAHSTGHEVPVSSTEDFDPLGVTKEQLSPPPTVTHPAGIARSVLRSVTSDVQAHRLPTDVERGRLVERVVDLLAAGWDAEQLAARLRGMGPLSTVASVYAVLVSRLKCVGDPPPMVAAAAALGPWCGMPGCDRTTRRLVDDDERPRFAVEGGHRVALWCPACSGR